MNQERKNGFSLLEISAVILIIGILIAGVMGGNILVAKTRIAAAKTLTVSSPINGIKDSALWLESSTDSSFPEGESASNSALSTWYDTRQNSANKINISSVGSGPVYSNTINSIHAVKFAGSSANYLQIDDASFLNNTDYTIIILEKRQSNSSDNYFFGESPTGTANQKLALGYNLNGKVIHAQGTNSYTANVSSYEDSADKAKVFTFVSDSSSGKKTYINGVLAAENSDTAKLSGITSLPIGKSYSGEIGEIAIFTRALKGEERKAVEDYIGKKFTTKINRDAVVGGCTTGTITPSGCSKDCSTSAISGVSSPSTIADGITMAATCGQSGYNGSSISLTCSNGSLSGGSCGCGVGYITSGSNCITFTPCNTSGITGINNGATISQASGVLNCNATGFNTSDTVSYSCSGGNISITSGACDTCDTANGYSWVGGTCVTSSVPCTGGVVDTTSVPGSTIHKFLSSANLVCTATKNIQYLIVGGGGGSGAFNGGGGAGGFRSGTTSIVAGTYPIVVGAAGAKENGPNSGGSNGGNSSFNGIISNGGGKGWHSNNAVSGSASGGGGGYSSTVSATGIAGQGNSGGRGSFPGNWSTVGACGGGGGGAGGAGGDAGVGFAGAGGTGISSSITGTTVYYAVGGPGSGYNSSGVLVCSGTPATGGSTVTQDGAANTGNGGGGGNVMWSGQNGGSGIVVIKY